MALAAKRGHIPPSRLQGPAHKMYESMSEEELSKMASMPNTSHRRR